MMKSSVILAALWTSAAGGVELIPAGDLERLNLQRYWHLRLPLDGGEAVTRITLVDDNLYVMTTMNRALAVHAATGVVRWSAIIADPDKTVRGPTHTGEYVLFTTPAAVKILDRRSGDLPGQARTLRGFVTDVSHDMATISIGEEHGVRDGDLLRVFRSTVDDEATAKPLAELRISSVRARSARGRMVRVDTIEDARPGDRVFAEVTLPLGDVKLPFAASSPAVSDGHSLFVAAANERLYSIEILTGIQQWAVMTPRTVTTTPILRGEWLYYAGQDGLVICCTKEEKAKNWSYQVEGAVFAEPYVDDGRIYVSSSDRSLYCLDRMNGGRVWRQRFNTPLMTSPRVAEGRVYQEVPEQGLIVVSAKTGTEVWRRPEGGQFLLQIGEDAFIWDYQSAKEIGRVNPQNGRRKEWVESAAIEFVVAVQKDQSIFVGSAVGDLMCLRSKNAPRLMPEQLAEVLKNDAKMRLAAEMSAKEKATSKPAEPEKKPEIPWWEQDDGLASRSTAVPLGGHGLVRPAGAPADGSKSTTTAPAEESEGASAEKSAEESEEAADAEKSTEEPESEESAEKSEKDEEATTTQKADEDEESDEGEKDSDEESSKESEPEKP